MATDLSGAGISDQSQVIYDGVVADGLALVVEMVVYGAFSFRQIRDTTCSFALSPAGFYACMVLFSTTIIA